MADIFVANTGSNTAPYDTWAKAATTLVTGAGAATNADTVYVDTAHTESQVTAMTITFPTTAGLRVLCVTPNGASGNSGLATGAQVAIGAGSVAMSFTGHAYVYGITFLGATNSSASAVINIGSGTTTNGMIFQNCVYQSRTANTLGHINIGSTGSASNTGGDIHLIDCNFKFGATGQNIVLRSGRVHIVNMSIDSTGSTPTTLFAFTTGAYGNYLIESSDLSGETFTNLTNLSVTAASQVMFRNCKLPASVTIATGTIPNNNSLVLDVQNCDSADTNYRLAHHDYAGTVVNETTIVKSGGASDGTTSVSYKMSTSANSKFPTVLLESPEMFVWNDTSGSSKTVTVEIVHDSQGAGTGSAFQDDEIWLEVHYLGTSGVPQGTKITDCKANVLASAADQDSSSVTWTTTGLTTPVKQKLSVTFTPQEKGVILARVIMAKASKVCYIDPVLTIS